MFAVVCAGENAVLFYDERLKLISKKTFEQPQLGLRRALLLEDTLYITAANAGGVVKYNMKSSFERFRAVCAYPTDIVQTKNGLAVCCGESENVTAISRALNITKRVAAASFPIAMSTSGGEIFVSCLASACVRVLDDMLNEKRVIQLSDYPYYALVCGDSLVVAASEEGYLTSGRIHFIENGKIVKSVPVGAMPSRLIYLNGRIFCANTGDGTLSIIDAYKKTEVRRVPTPEMPETMAVYQGMIYLTCMCGTIAVLDQNGRFVKRVQTGAEPRDITFLQ